MSQGFDWPRSGTRAVEPAVTGHGTAALIAVSPAAARQARLLARPVLWLALVVALLAGLLVAAPQARAAERTGPVHRSGVGSAPAQVRVVGFPALPGPSDAVGPRRRAAAVPRSWIGPATQGLMRLGWTLVRRCLEDQACAFVVRSATQRATQWIARALVQRFGLTLRCLLTGVKKERYTCLVAPRK